ncbi:MAG: hypothetical protein ACFBSF_20105 [Leptolyngbyaceae cyanobacterium]
MSVTIDTLHRMDGHHNRHFGSITHNGQTLDAVLVGPYDRLQYKVLHRSDGQLAFCFPYIVRHFLEKEHMT